LGNAFISLAENEYNDIVLDRTMEDLQDNLPDISDDTAKQLISAFSEHTMDGWQGDSVKENRIKRALYDILGDDDKTEKAFTSIAYMKYNYKAEQSPDKVNDEPKRKKLMYLTHKTHRLKLKSKSETNSATNLRAIFAKSFH
jgi:hypothetical protein